MNKRALRKFAVPKRRLNLQSGVFCAEQIKYVIATAVHNIAHRRTLVLYIYAKEDMSAGACKPRWTMFQTKEEYITLNKGEKGSRWLSAMLTSFNKDYYFTKKCAFYSLADEKRVVNFCELPDKGGFDCLYSVQYSLLYKRQKENSHKAQRNIIQRMTCVGKLPRDIKGFMHRETLPQYIFYDYHRSKAPMEGYCTACKHEVSVAGAKHNAEGLCPRCKKKITFKSNGKRGYIVDRSTAQVIQRVGENEIVIRFVKAYCRYTKHSGTPYFSVHENARLFLGWEGKKLVKREHYYYCYAQDRLTPWHKGDRPVFSRWQYNFEADCSGFLYHRNLDKELKGTPWQYSALKEYYFSDPTELYAPRYLTTYLQYPMLEYLVKLRLYRLATYVAYGDSNGSQYYGNSVLNSDGKTVTEVLGVGKRYVPFLQEVNPGAKQLQMIRAMLRENIEPDMALMKWCSEYGVGNEDEVIVPLRFMTSHRFLRYATEHYLSHRRISYTDNGYYSMSSLTSDYKDYLCMAEALGHDMKSSFVLFPNDLKAEHDRVNDLTKKETSKAYDCAVAKRFEELQNRYGYENFGLIVVPPHSAKEITREGDKLHHCVGRYVKDVVKNNCTILFIRKASAPKKPFCTVEVKHGDVVQARIQNNSNPPAEVQRFIELWKQQVLYAAADMAA